VPLIIGQLNASIHVDAAPPAAESPIDKRDEELSRLRALSAERFERERRIDQRDPDRLGGG